jgi:hypothetical protein
VRRRQPAGCAEPQARQPRRAARNEQRAVLQPPRAEHVGPAPWPRPADVPAALRPHSAPPDGPADLVGRASAPCLASVAPPPARVAGSAPSLCGRRRKSPPPPGWPRKSEMSCVSYEPRPPVDRSPPLSSGASRAQRSGADPCSNANNTTKLRRTVTSCGAQRKASTFRRARVHNSPQFVIRFVLSHRPQWQPKCMCAKPRGGAPPWRGAPHTPYGNAALLRRVARPVAF